MLFFFNGVWRSLVARLLWEQDVGGSNPLTPTIQNSLGLTHLGESSSTMKQLQKIIINPFFQGALWGAFFLSIFISFNQTQTLDLSQRTDIIADWNSLNPDTIISASQKPIISQTPEAVMITMEPGDTLADVLRDKKIPMKQVLNAIQALSKHLNLKKIKANEKISLLIKATAAGTYDLIRLLIAKGKSAQIEVIQSPNGGYQSRIIERELEQITECVCVPIKGSLYADAFKKGVPHSVVSQLVTAYSYDVDFQRDIQTGDCFEVYYEASIDKLTKEEFSTTLLFANLKIKGKNRPIYAFETSSGTAFYYADGQSVKKQFMVTPINGARITSGFGPRIHPIHGYTRFHKGLDFGAPRGTPVLAAADGVVTMASWYSTFGHYIEIRHANGYSTAYAHLNGYAQNIRSGMRVSQGQKIGFVGSTGASTGPHLHFELKKNGVQINPRTKSAHHATNRLEGVDLQKFLRARGNLDNKVKSSLSP